MGGGGGGRCVVQALVGTGTPITMVTPELAKAAALPTAPVAAAVVTLNLTLTLTLTLALTLTRWTRVPGGRYSSRSTANAPSWARVLRGTAISAATATLRPRVTPSLPWAVAAGRRRPPLLRGRGRLCGAEWRATRALCLSWRRRAGRVGVRVRGLA